MTTNSRARISAARPTRTTPDRSTGRITRERKPRESAVSEIVSLGNAEGVLTDMLKGMKPIVDPFRGGELLHVSDVIHKCMRQLALIKRLDTRPPGRRLRDSEVITFRQGEVMHDFVRQRFAENHPDESFGRWSCVCKKTITQPMVYSHLASKAKACEHCGTVPYKYEEVPVPDREYGLVGNPDFLLFLHRLKAYHVTEIKSIAGDAFAELARPIPDHVIQVVFYWHLLKRAGRKLTDKVSILYVNKAWGFKSPYKEFLVDAVKEERRLQPYIEDLLRYKGAVADPSADLPPKLCGKIDAPDAKECAVRVACFGE